MKKVIVLLAAVILASCTLIPEIEGPYPADNTANLSKDGEQLFNTRGRENRPPAESQDSAEDRLPDESGAETQTDTTAEPAAEPAIETTPDSVSVPGDTEPLFMEEQARETELDEPGTTEPDSTAEELAEAYYPEQVPNEEAAAIPLDEPLVQLPPEVPDVQPAPPVEPPPVALPPQRETPPAAPPLVPPAPPEPSVLPPVEEIPPEETPPEEVPPQPEREPYTPPIPNMPFQPETAAPALTENELPYSRTVRAVVGQYIEIPFRGPGWVYLGEFGSRRGVRYDSRHMDPDGMTFVFRADAEGTYSLKFNRQDFVRDYILNDYVRVIVEEPPAMTGSSWSHSQVGPDRVYASPRWPLATDPEARGARQPNSAREETRAAVPQESPALPQTSEPQANANPQSVAAADSVRPGAAENTAAPLAQTGAASVTPAGSVPPAGTAPAVASAATDPAQISAEEAVPQIEDWLKKAWDEYNAGRIPGALEALDQFMIRFPGGSDEAFWLYGQSLEANNEGTRDIRLALDYYRRLTNEFPQSSRYDEARRRIAYLERFYFSIQ